MLQQAESPGISESKRASPDKTAQWLRVATQPSSPAPSDLSFGTPSCHHVYRPLPIRSHGTESLARPRCDGRGGAVSWADGQGPKRGPLTTAEGVVLHLSDV